MCKGQQHRPLSKQTCFFLCFYTETPKVPNTSGLAWLPTQGFSRERHLCVRRLFSQPVSTMNAVSFTGWMILTQGEKPRVSSCCPDSKPAVIGNKSDCHSASGSPESLNWFLTPQGKRYIIYCSPAKPPTPDICVMLFSLQNTSTSDISRVVNKAHQCCGVPGEVIHFSWEAGGCFTGSRLLVGF